MLGLLVCACSGSVDIPDEVAAAAARLPETVDFNLHIKPILSDRCFKCHGPDKSKIEAGLQLASFEGATKTLEEGQRAIVPGSIAKSELVRRILSHDPKRMMPTPASNLTLSDEEKALLIRWIEQGAEYKEHWSLAAIEKPEVPRVGNSFLARWGLWKDEETRWVKNEIDPFTLVKMKRLGLNPAPEAPKTTLLRRVSMDLTGLPPSPAETAAFLTDNSENAYEKAVDRLLKSPHFGEQQAVSWLDLARYADSNGYQDDGLRNAWPYRDWVIGAFNENLPFDQFVQQQLAGDLMPKPTRKMLVATAFNRQHPQTQEGGVIPEEYRTEYVADRVNTFGKAFLGLTMECARCHDHKYDPILAKDYYSLFAFFNQNKESGVVPYRGEPSPTVLLPSTPTEQSLRVLRAKINRLLPRLQPEHYRQPFENWLTQPAAPPTLDQGLLVHLPLDGAAPDSTYPNRADKKLVAKIAGDLEHKPLLTTGKMGNALHFRGDCGLEVFIPGFDKTGEKLNTTNVARFGKGLNFESNQSFSVSVWVNPLVKGNDGDLFQRSGGDADGWRGYAVHLNPDQTLSVVFSYTWPANCIEYRTKEKLTLNAWQHLTLTYDGSSKASGVRLYLNGAPTHAKILTDNLTKSLLHDGNVARYFFVTPFELGTGYREKTIADVRMDELRIYNRQLSGLEIQSLTSNQDRVAAVRRLPVSTRSFQQKTQLLEHYALTTDTSYAALKRQYTDLRGQEVALLTAVPEVMAMQELPADQSRKTYLLNRGVYDAHGQEVRAETPIRLGKLPAGYPRNRLGLARWLLDGRNPLFARVMVNRFWQQYFGNGLVKTQEDFGNQGELPSHPELLDWLAVQFRQDGWDTKRFIRRLVLSATYRQSSTAPKEDLEKDPDNRWLARGPSYRFAAEQVRDNALAASGLLARKIGGPSVYPYQPAGIWEAMARNVSRYRQHHGDSLYRRSMYTIWKRSSPPPMMLNFDSPDRSLCTVRRQKTATPLQALVTLNDPQFVEAARVLAERTMKKQSRLDGRIALFFQSALSRPPRRAELRLMQQLYAIEYQGFVKNPARAEALLGTGEFPRDNTLDPAQVAAFTVVANTVLNSDEAITKR